MGNKHYSYSKNKGEADKKVDKSWDRKQTYNRPRKQYDEKKVEKLAKGSNDPAWYAASKELLRDSASIPYSWPVGTPIDLLNPLDLTSANRKWAVPGIQTIHLMPSVGLSNTPGSPINVAANATYAFVRHANSGHSNYDAPDLMLYIMSMSQIYSYICYLQRMYGVASLYAQTNRYLPDALLVAMGANPESIRSSLSDFRYGINLLINKAASFAVPSEMTVFNRQAFLYSNVYIEGSSLKDQLYMYVPHSFWKYEWDTETQSGKLISSFMSSNMNVQSLLGFGNYLIDALIYDEDINIMSGDILKAYGADKIMKLMALPTEYPILPLYNLEVLEQMQNATSVLQEWESAYNNVECSITQDPTHGWLISEPKVKVNSKTGTVDWKDNARMIALKTLGANKIISTQNPEATPDITMENTRLVVGMSGWKQVNAQQAEALLICGSEIPVQTRHWYNKVTTDEFGRDSLTLYPAVSAFPWMTSTDSDVTSNIDKLCRAGVFKFRPNQLINVFKQSGSTVNPEFIQSFVYNIVDNYAILNNQDIDKLHSAALMNELHVPFIGKV